MKTIRLILVVIITMVLVTNCKWFNKDKQDSNDVDTLEAFNRKQDSIRKADSIDALMAIEQARADSIMMAEEEERLKQQSKYHLVVGSFMTPNNADVYSTKLAGQGLSTQIIDAENGFRLVSVSNFSNFDDAIVELRRMRTENKFEVWLYTRK